MAFEALARTLTSRLGCAAKGESLRAVRHHFFNTSASWDLSHLGDRVVPSGRSA